MINVKPDSKINTPKFIEHEKLYLNCIVIMINIKPDSKVDTPKFIEYYEKLYLNCIIYEILYLDEKMRRENIQRKNNFHGRMQERNLLLMCETDNLEFA